MNGILGIGSNKPLPPFFDKLRKLGSLLTKSGVTEKDILTPYHRSIKDWIIDSEKSDPYSIDISYGHKKLAEYGWRLFENGKLNKKLHEQFKSFIVSLINKNYKFITFSQFYELKGRV